MPQMIGPELARRLTAHRPAMKVLCMSGYPERTTIRRTEITAGTEWLQKPFTPAGLSAQVRQVLDAPAG